MSNFNTSAIIREQSMNVGNQQRLTPSYKAGRMKTEQVILEFLYKATELIIQSRVNLRTNEDYESSRITRRARFNLDIEEMQYLRKEMRIWKENVYSPLIIDIYSDGVEDRILLERWKLFHLEGHTAPTIDVIQQLKEVCKKIGVLLRALFVLMRQLPTHQYVIAQDQLLQSQLAYHLYTGPHYSQYSQQPQAYPHDPQVGNMSFEPNASVREYQFQDVPTPVGILKIQVAYRQNFDKLQALEQPQTSFTPSRIQENYIIQDYIPESSINSTRPMHVKELSHQTERYQSSSAEFESKSVNHSTKISAPMAIPQESTPSGYSQKHEVAGSGSSDTMFSSPLQTHAYARSYGGTEDSQLASINHTTPAPYGYGNIHSMSTSPQISTLGSSNGQSSFASSQTRSFRQLNASGSGHNAPSPLYNRLTTPPRHPNTSPNVTGTSLKSGSSNMTHKQLHHVKTSFENFRLDESNASTSPIVTTPPLPAEAHARKSLGFRHGETPPRDITPPFLYSSQPPDENLISKSSARAIVVRRKSMGTPPFQANPSQLLSTSPGYSFSKQYSTRGRQHSSPMFMTTDLKQRALGLPFDNTMQQPIPNTTGDPNLAITKFSGDFFPLASSELYDTGATLWGVESPDTPDGFSIELHHKDPPSLKSAIEAHQVSHESYHDAISYSTNRTNARVEKDENISDDDEYLLPFVLPEKVDSHGSTTISPSQSSQHGKNITKDKNIADRWNTTSVGTFLNQLKRAPQLFNAGDSTADKPNTSVNKENTTPSNDQARKAISIETLDEDLKAFQQLRQELVQEL